MSHVSQVAIAPLSFIMFCPKIFILIISFDDEIDSFGRVKKNLKIVWSFQLLRLNLPPRSEKKAISSFIIMSDIILQVRMFGT